MSNNFLRTAVCIVFFLITYYNAGNNLHLFVKCYISEGEKEYECFTGWRSHCHDCVSIGNADDRLHGFQTE